MSTRDVLRYIVRCYKRGEISYEEFDAFVHQTVKRAIGLRIEKTARRVLHFRHHSNFRRLM